MAARPTVAAKHTMSGQKAENESENAAWSRKASWSGWLRERTAPHECGVMATLDVVIEKELVGMRAQANFVDLARPLVA